MSKIVYYPVATDIFSIGESAGISYYIADKCVHTDKELKIICVGQKIFNTDGFEHINYNHLVNNKIANIIKKVSHTNKIDDKLNLKMSYYTSYKDSGHERLLDTDLEIWGGQAGGAKDASGKQFYIVGYLSKYELNSTRNIDKYKACLSIMPTGNNKYGIFDESGMAYGLKEIQILKPNQIPKGSFYTLEWFNTFEEADSFKSYFNTRFIRFLIICGIAGTSISKVLFRFVPDPGNFDHLFTDQELYKKYNLTDEEIHIIESVIKLRK